MANSQPPPNANPFTAAIIGLVLFSIFEKISCPLLDKLIASVLVKSENAAMSAPATNAFGPVPVIIADLIEALV